MGTALSDIAVALAALTDGELHALIDATGGVPQTAPGLLTWIEGACDWELNRRHAQDYDLRPLAAAIPPEENPASVYAAMALRSMFAQDSRASATLGLLHAIVEQLTGAERKD